MMGSGVVCHWHSNMRRTAVVLCAGVASDACAADFGVGGKGMLRAGMVVRGLRDIAF